MDILQTGRRLSHEVRQYIETVLPLLRDTLQATLTASLLFVRLLFVLLHPLLALFIHLYHSLLPSALRLASQTWTLFCQQPADVLAMEALCAVLLLMLSLLERRYGVLRKSYAFISGTHASIKRRYKCFLDSLRDQSRVAAAALPHLLYVGGVVTFHMAMAKHTPNLTTGACVILFGCIRPVVRTVLLLYTVDMDDDDDLPERRTNLIMSAPPAPPGSEDRVAMLRRRRPSEEARTRTANGSADIDKDGEGGALVKRQVRIREEDFKTPERRKRTSFTDKDESAVREYREKRELQFWTVFGLAWAARSLTWYFCPGVLDRVVYWLDCALLYLLIWAQISLTMGAEVIYAIVSRFRRGVNVEKKTEQVGLLMRMLVATGLINAKRAEEVEELVAESGLALLGVVFLITPRVATFVGTVLIGLLLPCYLTMGLVQRGNRDNWMAYWAVFAVLECIITVLSDGLGWMPLWYHAKMVLVLWLQLPYYRGAGVLLEWCMGRVGAMLSSVKKQVVTPRKRKRA